MTVEQIPFEPGRFYVWSESRADVCHVVDLRYQENPWNKPTPTCFCEQCAAKGFKVCKHLVATVEFERERLGI
jgi:hypothetical protein